MKPAHIAFTGATVLFCLSSMAIAAPVRPYPFGCDGAFGSFIEPGRVCYYFAMREQFGTNGFAMPFGGYGPEGYADPRAWRLHRVRRAHRPQ